jgi:hypothetical protein
MRRQDKTRTATRKSTADKKKTTHFSMSSSGVRRAINLITLGENGARKITLCVGEECARERRRQSFIRGERRRRRAFGKDKCSPATEE